MQYNRYISTITTLWNITLQKLTRLDDKLPLYALVNLYIEKLFLPLFYQLSIISTSSSMISSITNKVNVIQHILLYLYY